MKAFIISTLVAIAAAQLDACGQTCVNSMLGKAQSLGCSATDFACLCQNTDFAFGLRDCAVEACSGDVAPQVIAYGVSVCSSAGVQIAGGAAATALGTGTAAAATGTGVTTGTESGTETGTETGTGTEATGTNASGMSTGTEGSGTETETGSATTAGESGTGVSGSETGTSGSGAETTSGTESGTMGSGVSGSSTGNMAMRTAAPVIGGAFGALAVLLL